MNHLDNSTHSLLTIRGLFFSFVKRFENKTDALEALHLFRRIIWLVCVFYVIPSLLQWLFAIGGPSNRCKYDLKFKVNLKTIRREIVASVLKHRVGRKETLWVFLTSSLCVDERLFVLYCTVDGGSHCRKLVGPNETTLNNG